MSNQLQDLDHVSDSDLLNGYTVSDLSHLGREIRVVVRFNGVPVGHASRKHDESTYSCLHFTSDLQWVNMDSMLDAVNQVINANEEIK